MRAWRRHPAFALAAVGTLALGIGANTAIFSVVSGVLLRPLPFAAPDRLVMLNVSLPTEAISPVEIRHMEEWRARAASLDGVAGYTRISRTLENVPDPEQLALVAGEREMLGVLGAVPMAGRIIRKDDPPTVAVASYGFWKRRLGGDYQAVGRSIQMDGEAFTIVGVMPPGFRFPYNSAEADLWVPWEQLPQYRGRGRMDLVIARLKPGVTLPAAQAELSAMAGRVAVVRPLKDVVAAPARESLLVLLGAVGIVLLVACVNVANLLLARMAARSHEVAIRLALGAGRWRLIQQFLTESLLLAFSGGAAGLLLGIWGRRLLVSVAEAQIPRASEIGLDWRVFAFLLAVCFATGLGFGIVPAVAAARGAGALKQRTLKSAMRDGLVIAEVALAFLLLAGAGLLLRTFVNLRATDPGLRAENVLTLHTLAPDASRYKALEERIARVPGVDAVGFVSYLPLQSTGWWAHFNIRGTAITGDSELRFATPGYFRAIGIPIRQGRGFSPEDTAGKPTVILVNEALARRYFPNQDPIGRVTDRGLIVGVVGDIRGASLERPPQPEIYYTIAQNLAQQRSLGLTMVVRGRVGAQTLASAFREVNPNQAVFRVSTMEDVIDDSLADQRLYLWLLGVFATLGTGLAAAGIYSVIAYLVTLRAREFGIRMALGADAPRILRLVAGRGAALVSIGIVLGIGGATALMRVLKNVLFGVTATDPVTFAAMAALLAAVAMAACIVPARRASQVNPSVALRSE